VALASAGAEIIGCTGDSWSERFKSSARDDWRKAQLYLNEIGGDRRAVIREAKAEVTRLLLENVDWLNAATDLLQKERCITGNQALACEPVPPMKVIL